MQGSVEWQRTANAGFQQIHKPAKGQSWPGPGPSWGIPEQFSRMRAVDPDPEVHDFSQGGENVVLQVIRAQADSDFFRPAAAHQQNRSDDGFR